MEIYGTMDWTQTVKLADAGESVGSFCVGDAEREGN